LVLAIQAKCPDLSSECIINHEAWYKTYLELREKQKLELEEWRKRKEMDRLGKVAKVEESRPLVTARQLNFLGDKAAVDKKEMIRQWKEQREKSRTAQEEQLQKCFKTKKENKENCRRVQALRLVAESKDNKTLSKKKSLGKPNNSVYSPVMSSFILHMYRYFILHKHFISHLNFGFFLNTDK
jgi:hypothetical protein